MPRPATVQNALGGLVQLYAEMLSEVLQENERLRQAVTQLGEQLKAQASSGDQLKAQANDRPRQSRRRKEDPG